VELLFILTVYPPKKILCTKKQEKRNEAIERSLLAGDDFEKSSKALLLRLNLMKAQLIVK